MMDKVFGIRVFMDGDELDCDAYGNVKVSVGTFSALNNGAPHRAQVDIYDTWDGPGAAYTNCVIMLTAYGVGVAASLINHYLYDDGAGLGSATYSMVLFSGKVASRQGRGPATHLGQRVIKYDFLGDESMVFNRKTTLTADTDLGQRQLITKARVDLSLPAAGINGWPDETWVTHDLPDQNKVAVGSYLRTVCSDLGNWVTAEWDWDGSSDPDFIWRPAYFSTHASVDSSRQEGSYVGHGWMFDFRQVGLSFTDIAAKVVVNGRNSAGVEKTGSDTIATPSKVGERTTQVTTFIDNNSDCGTVATKLVNRCDPERNRIQEVAIGLESYWQRLWDDTDDYDDIAFAHSAALQYGCLRPGDYIGFAKHPDGVTWPDKALPILDEFTAMLGPWDDHDVDGFPIQYTLVASTSWQWSPTWGWIVSRALEPIEDTQVASL